MSKIIIASDHGGYKLKEKIKKYLLSQKYKVIDAGTNSEESCDYPVFGKEAAKQVVATKGARGILICTSGIGMSIVANKVKGIRAGLCNYVEDASFARKHNDTNVLVLAAKRCKGKKAFEIIDTWLNTKFDGGRHARRVRQIEKI
ncbi:MAG: ribose 5-phosphate isomerase B [Candidatus Omnitrophica bacterium]|nr:ribose 5-phosphate isomerase B [Candidatus Omnitrophota bacterium]